MGYYDGVESPIVQNLLSHMVKTPGCKLCRIWHVIVKLHMHFYKVTIVSQLGAGPKMLMFSQVFHFFLKAKHCHKNDKN